MAITGDVSIYSGNALSQSGNAYLINGDSSDNNGGSCIIVIVGMHPLLSLKFYQ